MLKELTVKEALQILAENYPEQVKVWFWDEGHKPIERNLDGIAIGAIAKFRTESGAYFYHCAIEVPCKYRPMTQQECIDWVCLHGYKDYQVRLKGKELWTHPTDLYYISGTIENYEYRTIQEIDGKVVYGEPMEFKVREVQ